MHREAIERRRDRAAAPAGRHMAAPGGPVLGAAERKWRRVWGDELARTMLLVNVAAVVERADEALLPAVYHEISVTFGIAPAALGTLTLMRALFQTLSYPLAAHLAVRHDRVHVIALGALIWGVATAAVGLAATYYQVMAARAINGVGLALVIPAIQALVADCAPPAARGLAFGWLQLVSNFGSVLGGAAGLLLAGAPLWGVAGWRWAFHLVAAVSLALAALLFFGGRDPQAPPPADEKEGWRGAARELLGGAAHVLRLRTFRILVAQGVVGSFPWAAMAFCTLWLELLGFSHAATGALLALMAAAGSAGALFGGWLGDWAAARHPDSGRIACAQFSAGVAVPIVAVLLRVLPPDTSWAAVYAALLVLFGLLCTWNAPATNNPIFAEIVPPRLRTSIYALDRTFEMALASFAPAIVGLLTEDLYGYKPQPKGAAQNTVAVDKANAEALAKGLCATMVVPLILCSSLYTFLYWTYPVDRDRARAEQFEGIQLAGQGAPLAAAGKDDDEEDGLIHGARSEEGRLLVSRGDSHERGHLVSEGNEDRDGRGHLMSRDEKEFSFPRFVENGTEGP